MPDTLPPGLLLSLTADNAAWDEECDCPYCHATGEQFYRDDIEGVNWTSTSCAKCEGTGTRRVRKALCGCVEIVEYPPPAIDGGYVYMTPPNVKNPTYYGHRAQLVEWIVADHRDGVLPPALYATPERPWGLREVPA